MTNVTIIGAQWGDEGKGKVVDWLSSRADAVARFQGGHNAGHTLVVGGVTYKLHLLPSGVVRQKLSFIGNGVVIDPWALLEEIRKVSEQGLKITSDILKIADNAPLILPVHRLVDQAREKALGNKKIGTTGRGIGPAYEDKVARRAIRVCDLKNKDVLKEKLEHLVAHHNLALKGAGENEIDAKDLFQDIQEISSDVLAFSDRVGEKLYNLHQQGKKILFEGAQGIMLDVDHGTYPYVTSSNTIASAAATGTGVGMKPIGRVLGICKAYTTRVGEGPFPTEQNNDLGEHIGMRGHEFGTTTGRKRRCGWLDIPMVRQAIRVGGIDALVLTKLDVLDELSEISIAAAYELDGEKIDYLPACAKESARVKPVYETFAGWQSTTYGARSYATLPAQAVKYIRHIEELLGVPIMLLSTSPEREDMIVIKDPYA